MNEQCLIAEFPSMEAADTGLQVLESDDFTKDQVSVVSRATQTSEKDFDDLESKHSDSPPAAESAAVGATVGGSVVGMMAASTMIGPFMVAGPLAGLAAGAAIGGLFSSTDRWGVDQTIGQDYERRVQQGAVLIIVNADDKVRLNDAERLLKTCGPTSMQRFRKES